MLTSLAFAGEFHHLEQVAAAGFPEGVQAVFEPEWRYSLYKEAQGTGLAHALTADNFVSLVLHTEITPSFPRLGPVIRFSPFAVWDMSFGVYGMWYFGTFSSILPLEDGSEVATRDWKQEQMEAGEREGGIAIQIFGSTRFKAKAGPVIAIAEYTVIRNDVYTWDGTLEWYWDPTDQVNSPAHGWVIRRGGYLFLEILKPSTPTDRKFWIGPVVSWVSNGGSGDENVRLGPVLLWKPTPAKAMPTILLGSQAWVISNFHETWPPYTFLATRWEN